ncbi:MAG: hypothetical protein B6244_09615 [Candidatus Cloacimonetes bacterium 4572_55]|nr:MAG: hypothetical protein B6244_09615 [Candidatus Cloacimonetes bacterium 4572_55]
METKIGVNVRPIREVEDENLGSVSLKEIQTFFRKGGDKKKSAMSHFTPVLLYPYLDEKKARLNYPVIIGGNSERPVPLSRMIDELIEKIGAEGDEGEKLRRALLRLEVEMKSWTDPNKIYTLADLWQIGSEKLASKIDEKKKEATLGYLKTAKQTLGLEGRVLTCSDKSIGALFGYLWSSSWDSSNKEIDKEVTELIAKLDDILRVDDAKSGKAKRPEYLKASMGAAEIDYNALSNVLSSVKSTNFLPVERRRRMEKNLRTLRNYWGKFKNATVDKIKAHDCVSALKIWRDQLPDLLQFITAARTAYLEINSKYVKFDKIIEANLDENDLALSLPILVDMTVDKLDAENRYALLEIANKGLPIKVLIRTNKTGSKLAQRAMMQGNLYVMQTTASHTEHLISGFEKGLAYQGPALFHVYIDDSPRISTYLHTASALESRAVPAFDFNPTGASWAERFDLSSTPQPESEWSTESVVVQVTGGGGNEETEREFCFTLADFLALNSDFVDYFMPVPKSSWNNAMAPIDDYLKMDDVKGKIPYISLVDHNGILWRAVVSEKLISTIYSSMNGWRSLQELAGINNSHVQKVIHAEKERLEEEKQLEIAAIQQAHQDELDKTVAEMTETIVSRIAAGLLTEGTSAPLISLAPSSSPKHVAPSEDSVKEVEVSGTDHDVADEEDEEEESFDDPYIDTPMCATCNECITRNSAMFAYDDNKQAYIKDLSAGTYADLVVAAEKCPVRVIHPGKPKDSNEPGLDELIKRAEPFN